jgi:hypothetical protein
MEEIYDDLHLFIRKLDFDYEEIPMKLPALAVPDRKVVLVNPDLVAPFHLAHEIVHIKEKHHGRLKSFNGNDERNPNEHDADVGAIYWLLHWHRKHGLGSNYVDFMQWYGVPIYLENTVIEIFREVETHVC